MSLRGLPYIVACFILGAPSSRSEPAPHPVAPIPIVHTAGELRSTKPVGLRDGQLVHVGVTEPTEGCPWRLLYALSTDPKGAANDPDGDPEEWLGALKVRIMEGREANEMSGSMASSVKSSRAGERFSCTAIQASVAGKVQVEVIEGGVNGMPERVLYRSTFETAPAAPCYWHHFATAAGEHFVVDREPFAARPRYSGMLEYAWPSDLKPDSALDGIDAQHPLTASLDLSVAEPEVHVSCAANMLDSSKDFMLARWWVDGRPIMAEAVAANEKAPKPHGWQLSFSRELTMRFALPRTLGTLKPGAIVRFQIMYVPGGAKPCYSGKAPPMAKDPQFIPRIVAHPDTLPRLSNVVEVTVTQDMLN